MSFSVDPSSVLLRRRSVIVAGHGGCRRRRDREAGAFGARVGDRENRVTSGGPNLSDDHDNALLVDTWSEPHSASAPGWPGRQRWLLLAVMGVALVRGLFWVALAPVWNPVDETAHFGYVEFLATGHGIPKVDEDLVSNEVLRVAKESPTYYFRTRPHGVDASDPAWDGTRYQYEGVQGPVYYLLMVPAYWLGRPFGILGALYTVRVASVLLSLMAVPLAWLLARELFPRFPAIWVATPALLALSQGFNANLACVSNDALAVVASTGTLVLAVRGVKSPSSRNAIGAGALLGLSVLNKRPRSRWCLSSGWLGWASS